MEREREDSGRAGQGTAQSLDSARRERQRGETPVDSAQREDERGETPLERLDRNTSELVNELRVAGTGVQVLFAFLLILPFNTGFRRVSATDRYIYYVSLLCVAVAAVLLIAPSVHHRILFREGEKAHVVQFGTRVAVIASGFLCAGLTGILVVISDYLFGTATATVVGIATAATVITVWFVIPLRLLRKRRRQADSRARFTTGAGGNSASGQPT